MKMIVTFEIRAGLSGTGPPPVNFSATGAGIHSEGLVVCFHPGTSCEWVGNFQRGSTICDAVVHHPDGKNTLVVAGGQAYVVDAHSREAVSFEGVIAQIFSLKHPDRIIIDSQGLALVALCHSGLLWHTRRISWDGIRNIRIEGNSLQGEASGVDDRWHQFEVNLITGVSTGGSYDGPPESWEKLATS